VTITQKKEREMKQLVRVIKTQRDYDAALARLSALMDEKFAPGSEKEAELELLALVIESYERSKVAPISLDPIDAILFRMDQQKLSKKDLIPYFGSLSKVSEVLSHKRRLSLAMMRKLHLGLDIPADILLGGSDQDGIDLAEDPHYDYARFPWQEMIDRRYFDGFVGSIKEAKERAEELIRGFMHGFTTAGLQVAWLRSPLSQGGARLMDEYALLVWQVAVLKKARARKLPTRYKQGSITDEWLRDLSKLSRFAEGPRLAQEYLADIGIVLVIEEHFKKTYLDGAAMLDGAIPVVALTLRHDRADNFWFALIHELVHVQKHLSQSKPFIADNLDDKTRTSREEQEADVGAREALIPNSEWKKSAVRSDRSPESAIALADQLRIHQAIVAGRVRFETGNWRLLTGLKATVRQNYADQLGVAVSPAGAN
jgi:HTH-type transcriptional regulator / antitoxin HigA